MTTETTHRHESGSAQATPLRQFRVPQHISEDLAFALETGDGEVLVAVVKKHGMFIDAFTTSDVPSENRDPQFRDMPEILVVSLTFGADAAHLLLALPASLSKIDGVELAVRIAASGKTYSDRSAISVELNDGRELLLYGGWDTSPDEVAVFILGHRTDVPMGRPLSKSTH